MRIYPIFKITLAFLFFFPAAAYSAAPLYFIKTNNAAFTKDSTNSLSSKSITSPLLVPISDIAPKITATGNQTYCPGTSLKIVTDVVITDSDDSGTDAIYIQISSGYINGQDQLTLMGFHPTIATNWDISAGKLKLSSTIAGTEVSYNDLTAAIKDVAFSNSSATPSGIRNFSISIGQANYLPRNGHYYEFVPNLGITWTASKAAAETSTYYGLQGYLATITASDEAKIAGEQASGAGWIGGSDAGTEGIWKWVTGPEFGTLFSFTFWNNTEPNNVNNNEHYAHITAPGIGTKGSWNDLSDSGDSAGSYQPKGYIVEYGGMPGDPILEIAASTSITIPQTTGTTSVSRCGSGIVTLQATASNGTIKWYDASINGNLLATGNSYTTPSLSTTTTYYVEVECPMSRIPVVATIKTIPSITSANTPISRCGAGSVTLQATADIGTINWYSTPTGGTIEATGTSFTVPNSTVSTTYYAEAVNNGCVSMNRTPIDIIIYTPPVSTPQEAVLCKSGVVTLDALLSGMTYLWSTGETTQKIVVSTAGTYRVNVTSPAPENCASTNVITVIEHNTPEIDRIDVNESTVVIYLKQEEVYFEYSVDGINYQSSNVFYDAPSGFQTAYVRDLNYCSYDTENFIALIIPKFFTPNNDTYNDFWEVKGLINYPEAVVNIFDRYGKLITQLNASKLTWDGTLNKNLLPASDYWYVLKIDNTRPELRGHFSLKR